MIVVVPRQKKIARSMDGINLIFVVQVGTISRLIALEVYTFKKNVNYNFKIPRSDIHTSLSR